MLLFLRFQRPLAILTLALFIYALPCGVRQAQATSGAVAIGVPLALGALMTAAIAGNYYRPSSNSFSSSSTVYSTSMNAGRIVYAAWAEMAANNTAVMKNKLLTAKVLSADIYAAVAADYNNSLKSPAAGMLYPNLFGVYGSLSVPRTIAQNPPGYVDPNGQPTYFIDPANGNKYLIGAYQTSVDTGNSSTIDGQMWMTGEPCFHEAQYVTSTHTIWWHKFAATAVTSIPITYVPKTTAQAKTMADTLGAASVPPVSPSNSTDSLFQGDIDRLIHDNPNIVHFVDTANPETDLDSAPPFVFPPGALSPSSPQVLAGGGGITAAASPAVALADAKQKLSDLTAAKTGLLTAGVPALDPRISDLTSAISDAQKAVDALQATQATTAPPETMPSSSADTLKTLNWNSLKSLVGFMGGVFPFSLVGGIAANYSALTATSAPPVYTIPLPLGQNLIVDLSPWDPVAVALRYLVSLLLLTGCVYYIVRFYRGVS